MPGSRSVPAPLDDLVTVLDLVRSGAARTRPELGRRSGLGRTAISQRIGHLMSAGLVEDGELGASTGGRAPRELRLSAGAGVVLAAELGATSLVAGVTDLAGSLLDRRAERIDVADGPEPVLARARALFDEMRPGAPVWGVGLGLPGPVEFATGRPSAPPIMPGWDGYPVRESFAAAYDAPVWVDNEVNTMALGEYRAGVAKDVGDCVYVKLGTGIGAGLISGGRLHRGSQGCAGDIGHTAAREATAVVCRCGNIGCLEALAGGAALARDGEAAAREGRSPALAQRLARTGTVEAEDVAWAASGGDRAAVELLEHAGRLIGEQLAMLVSFFNPSLVVLGGGVAGAGDQLLATIRREIYGRSLPLATRDLRIARAGLGDRAGVVGAAFMVLDELFARDRLADWIDRGSPAGLPWLAGSR
ncbi:ROK family protein [Amycolatopsis australiensis]|uniref:ROK family protein (Putative glucokinase) n=1 Tax=Amycolatopsis australiensis TaxID=546364 RepID=A0A1K1SLU6_9PSEU|nr:ROK family protein [Amycolatopsis australiensis]SFW85400.1 ROK family protein (putative glucokinase) [Amycolatopsis australiensis]